MLIFSQVLKFELADLSAKYTKNNVPHIFPLLQNALHVHVLKRTDPVYKDVLLSVDHFIIKNAFFVSYEQCLCIGHL